jgi:5-methylcytosine-specific restriction endonuclease McrA
MTWEEWILLPIRDQVEAVRTVRGAIRERDGNRCQCTGRLLRPEEGSLDHVVPRSRGGRDAWENLVWAAKEVNLDSDDYFSPAKNSCH